jgi:hypothetical protein
MTYTAEPLQNLIIDTRMWLIFWQNACLSLSGDCQCTSQGAHI